MSESIITPQERVDRALGLLYELRGLFAANSVTCNVHDVTLEDLAGIDGKVSIFPANDENGPFVTLDANAHGCTVTLFTHRLAHMAEPLPDLEPAF